LKKVFNSLCETVVTAKMIYFKGFFATTVEKLSTIFWQK